MGKAATKNKNLWSDDKLQGHYDMACKKFFNLVKIAREVQAGTYTGPMLDRYTANKRAVVDDVYDAWYAIGPFATYIHKRIEKYAKLKIPAEFKLQTIPQLQPRKLPEIPKPQKQLDDEIAAAKKGEEDMVSMLEILAEIETELVAEKKSS